MNSKGTMQPDSEAPFCGAARRAAAAAQPLSPDGDAPHRGAPQEKFASGDSFQALCHAVLEGTAGEGDLARLREILRTDPAARKAYTAQMQIHALLTWQHGRAALPGAVVPPEKSPDAAPRRESLRFPRWRFALAAAAALVLLAGLALWIARFSGAAGVPIEIIAASDAPFKPGQRLTTRRLDLPSGSLRFRLASGAVVEASAPASMELLDAMHLRMLQGSITADVGTEARGFAVETANAQVVDLGTRFGVSVGESGDTDVIVIDGEVEVHTPVSQASPRGQVTSLTEGDAVRVDQGRKVKRLQTVSLRGDPLALAGKGRRHSSSLVAGVSDNIPDDGFHRFYSIVPGGMTPGQRSYPGIRKVHWQASAGRSFPAELLGADAVGTFPADRKNPNREIRLEVTKPCAVYVLLDRRSEAPEWLRKDFRDTGLQVRSGPWSRESPVATDVSPDEKGRLHVEYAVWRRDIEAAGPVVLGPPRSAGEPGQFAMYGIAVK